MQLSKNIHALRHAFRVPTAPGQGLERFVYSVILFGDAVVLVDSGVKGCQDRIFDYIRAQGRGVDEISALILSHSHPDHIGSARSIQATTGCKILAHSAEQTWIEQPELQNQERPVPGFFDLVEGSVRVDGFLEDGQELELAEDLTLRCVHTPGHSWGSLSLLALEEQVLFSGDSIPVDKDIPNYEDYRDLICSLERLHALASADLLLSSWMEPVRGRARIQEVLAQGGRYMAAIDQAVRKHYAGPGTGMDACRKVLAELGLPSMFAIPMVHRAFLSHL